MSVEPIIEFSRRRAGTDLTAEGQDIDRWLEELTDTGDEVPWAEMKAIEARFDVAELQDPVVVDRSRAAFRRSSA